MNRTIKLAASVAAATAIGFVGLSATAVPASAQTIKAHGTITRKENDRMHHAVDKQKCFTVHEAQKMAGARGTVERYGNTTWVTFKGAKHQSVQSVSLGFSHNCAGYIESDLTKNRWQYTVNESIHFDQVDWDD